MVKILLVAFSALLIVGSVTPIQAQSKTMDTTDGLASACRLYVEVASQSVAPTNTDKFTQAGFCIGYMAGFAHAMSLEKTPEFCLPDTINLSETVKLFLKYVDEHPQDLLLSAKVTVPRALQQAYPCKPKQ
jgi:hypothetical protein